MYCKKKSGLATMVSMAFCCHLLCIWFCSKSVWARFHSQTQILMARASTYRLKVLPDVVVIEPILLCLKAKCKNERQLLCRKNVGVA